MGLICYRNQNLSVKIVTSCKFSTNLEVLPIEMTLVLDKRRILLLGFYTSTSHSENDFSLHLENALTQLTFTSSKSSIETLEKGVEYV